MQGTRLRKKRRNLFERVVEALSYKPRHLVSRANKKAITLAFAAALVLQLMVPIFAIHGNPAYAAGVNYYVSTNGNDGNPGTESAPFRTIGKAISVAGAGDTVLVHGGTYYEANLNPANSGTSSSPITIKNYPGETPIVDGQAAEMIFNFGWGVTEHDYITVQGLHIQNYTARAVVPRTGGKVLNCIIGPMANVANTGAHADIIAPIGDNIEIAYNKFTDPWNAQQQVTGMIVSFGGANQMIHDNLAYIVTKNTNSQSACFFINGAASSIQLTNQTIYNNIFIDMTYNSSYFYAYYSPATGTTLFNNMYYGGLGYVSQNGYGSNPNISNTNIQIPQGQLGSYFVNPSGYDFHEISTAHSIGAGVTSYAGVNVASADLDGNPRTVNGKVDAGAYEYGSTSSTASSTGTTSPSTGTTAPSTSSTSPSTSSTAPSTNDSTSSTTPSTGTTTSNTNTTTPGTNTTAPGTGTTKPSTNTTTSTTAPSTNTTSGTNTTTPSTNNTNPGQTTSNQPATVQPADTTPPVTKITDPSPNQTITGTKYMIKGTTTDDVAVSKVNVAIIGKDGQYWTGNGWSAAATWLPADITSGAGTKTAAWQYQWQVPVGNNVPYTIKARGTDSSGNVEGTAEVTVNVNNAPPNTSTVAPPAPPATVEDTSTSFKIICLPGWNLIAAPTGTKVEGSLFTYDTTDKQYVKVASPVTGIGYWLFCSEPTILTITLKVIDKFDLELKPGWNMLANPFDHAIRLPKGYKAYVYNPVCHKYRITHVIPRGYGFWIKSTEAKTLTLTR